MNVMYVLSKVQVLNSLTACGMKLSPSLVFFWLCCTIEYYPQRTLTTH